MLTNDQMLAVLQESRELSSAADLERAQSIIDRVKTMTGAERDTIRAAFASGPLADGDVPSKAARDQLLEEEYIAKVIVKCEWGYNACTYKGAWAFKLIEAGA